MKTLIVACLLALPTAVQAMYGGGSGGCFSRGGVHFAVVLYALLSALGYWVLQHCEKETQGLVKKTGRVVAFTLIVLGFLGFLCGVCGHMKGSAFRNCSRQETAGHKYGGAKPECPLPIEKRK